MGGDRYCVVTKGEIALGFTKDEVRANLRALCKYQYDATLDAVFAGNVFVFKKDLDWDNAHRYQSALAKTGILCRIEKLFEQSRSNSADRAASVIREECLQASGSKRGNLSKFGFSSKNKMGVIVSIAGLLAVACFAIVSTLRKNSFPGVWSNQQGEFKTLAVALRKDGRGTFSTAIFSVPLRWERKDNGILIKTTLDNNVSEIFLVYDAKEHTFAVKGAGSDSAKVLRKVSNDEPPDIEAEIVKRAEHEQEKFKSQHKIETITIASKTALIADLTNRIRGFEGNGISHITVRSPEKNWQFVITYVNHHLGGMVVTDWKCVDKLSSTIKSSRASLPKPPDLPSKYHMPDTTRIALEKRLEEGQYRLTTETVVSRSLWAVESYRTELYFMHQDEDRSMIIGIVEYLLNDVFGACSGPYEVSK